MFRARSARLTRLTTGLALVSMTLLVSSTSAFGQASGTATIRGTVQDPSGGVLPGATVTLTNASTKGTQTAVTTEGIQDLLRQHPTVMAKIGRAHV